MLLKNYIHFFIDSTRLKTKNTKIRKFKPKQAVFGVVCTVTILVGLSLFNTWRNV